MRSSTETVKLDVPLRLTPPAVRDVSVHLTHGYLFAKPDFESLPGPDCSAF